MARYQFTDTDLAARRLQVLATVYEASSREFIRRFSGHTVERAVDLGCGPGYTTELVRDETRAKSVVGLDNSEKFVAEARKRGLDRVTFHTHDVTSTPFPTGPSDVMYCRYLLSHLPDLPNCLTLWSSQLRPGGVLLIEEVEEIHTSVGTLEVYLEIVDQLLRSQSTLLYVGPVLDALPVPGPLTQVSNSVQPVSVSVRDAATMFHMNIQSWRHQPYIRESYPEGEIQDLQDRLGDLASRDGSDGEITWGLRQLVYRRG